jgi:hypothetical protein
MRVPTGILGLLQGKSGGFARGGPDGVAWRDQAG